MNTYDVMWTNRTVRMYALATILFFFILINMTRVENPHRVVYQQRQSTRCKENGERSVEWRNGFSTEKHPEYDQLIVQDKNRAWKLKLERKVKLEVPFDCYFVQVKVDIASGSSTSNVTINKEWRSDINYTLGLGLNMMDVAVTSASGRSQHYMISINRRKRTAPAGEITPQAQSCSLVQDCDLAVFPLDSCGLHPSWMSWHKIKETGVCFNSSTLVPGHWLIPCTSCVDEESCWWSEAIWIMPNCSNINNETFDISSMAEQLKNKQVMFLGDSTNRGIMHSLVEKLNSTMFEYQKSHDFLSYPNIRNTNISFMYYPAFWRSTQPTFSEVLLRLYSSFSSSTVADNILVIGGVQWLSMAQLTELHHLILKWGLKPAQVIIKTHSSGFHFDVPGLSYSHNKSSLMRLVKRNSDIVTYAKSVGFKVVDTLQMTLSRWKEFLQGKCSCHFHEVIESHYQPDSRTTSAMSRLYQLGLVENSLKTYSIEGTIHQSYTDMVLNALLHT